MRYQRQGPGPLMTTLLAAVLVFGGYFLYMGTRKYIEQDYQSDQRATETAVINQTEIAIQQATRSFMPFPTSTRVPDCEMFEVETDSAWVRECPSFECRGRDRFFQGQEICVLGLATDFEFFDASEWYKIDMNFGESYLDVAYMHESVIRPANPTPRPSATFTPLPTITPLPTTELSPTPTSTPTNPPPTITPTLSDNVEF